MSLGARLLRQGSGLLTEGYLCTAMSGEKMKTTLRIVGVLLVLVGGIWFLQGINVLPGSFMTGQIRWAIYGGIALAAGIVLVVWASLVNRSN